MPDADVNGIRLYYGDYGEGVPIACIHGGGSSVLMWANAVEQLARLGRVIAYDRRVHAQRAPEPYERTSRKGSWRIRIAQRGQLARGRLRRERASSSR